MKTTSRLLGLCLSLSMLFALPACSGGQSASSAPSETTPAPTESSAAEESHYPVTVTTYNQNGEEAEQTFTKCPERVVSISQANTEMLVSLGLSDLIVATAHRTSTPWPETAAEYESLNFLAMDDYPSKEVVLSLEPDLIVGWGSLFAEDALGPVSEWNDRGVGTYLMNNTVSGLGNRTVEFLYDDIETLGQIFDVEDAAQAMIDDMKTRIAAIGEKVSALPDEQRVRVVTVQYVYENEFLGRGGTDFNRALTELAGGIQVNDNGEQSMEVLIDLDPDVLVILDLSSSPAQEKIDAIKANPTLQNIKAVQNDRFVVLDHAAFYCGGPRTVEAIETLAAAFYPDLFSA